MILADVRSRFTRADVALVLALLAQQGSEVRERGEHTLREQGLDALLDDPALLPALVGTPRGHEASLPLFCYVLVRHALLQAGERDRALADYAASVMLHFGLRDRAQRIHLADDQTYDTLASLLEDAERSEPRRAFLVRAHLGNYALWLSGMFPDHITERQHRRGGPTLAYYEQMGQQGFRMAAEHRLASEHGLTLLFALAAERFPLLRVALNRISDALLFPHHHSPDRLMRQVQDEARWRRAG
ncbi:MAG: hypothetical protein KF689_10755 [Gemmatimonadaceae bacterium]|nr:hypothetical protein [Gemmatimonadaceae bacterium]MCW5825921.1 hypothetical protein [Gemmatimonadaceae bacterium]